MGTKTFATATFDAKFVTNTTTIVINAMITKFGKGFKNAKACPMRSFNPVDLAEFERANPPPVSKKKTY